MVVHKTFVEMADAGLLCDTFFHMRHRTDTPRGFRWIVAQWMDGVGRNCVAHFFEDSSWDGILDCDSDRLVDTPYVVQKRQDNEV